LIPKYDFPSINREVAFEGEVGRQRKDFYTRYSRFKQVEIDRLVSQMKRDIGTRGESVSCSPGCFHCCLLYVFTTLQEADTITCFLYEHQDAFEHFLTMYPRWEAAITPIVHNIDRLEAIQEKILFGQETMEERQVFYSDLTVFADLNNPCPFLYDGVCTIYPVRPYSCACVLSSSPQEWCDRNNPNRQKPSIYKSHPDRASEMPYMGLATGIIFGCLPNMVYRIMVYGYSFLSSFQGLEGLKTRAAADPEIRTILHKRNIL
jgi:hypothetical protein